MLATYTHEGYVQIPPPFKKGGVIQGPLSQGDPGDHVLTGDILHTRMFFLRLLERGDTSRQQRHA